ncbi:MAG: helix-turn-helix domain-containing protein [Phycisphaera sp.]|nr:helix-turn-helix domain-containing protein [Phycisphaera sp.]
MRSSFEKITPTPDRSFRCFRRADPAFGYDFHHHPAYELTLIEDSQGQRFVGDHIDNYGPGDLVLMGPNLPHVWVSGSPATAASPAPDDADDPDGALHTAVVIQFERDCFGAAFFDTPELTQVAQMLDASSAGLRFSAETCAAVAGRMASMPTSPPARQMLTLLDVLEDLARRVSDAEPLAGAGFTATLDTSSQRRIDTVCQHIQQRYAETLHQPELAELAGMNPSALSRFFRRVTGRTLTDYINAVRVGAACRLLIETDRPVLDVCFACGFNNVSNFNRRFRRIKGVTPRAYRSRYRI